MHTLPLSPLYQELTCLDDDTCQQEHDCFESTGCISMTHFLCLYSSNSLHYPILEDFIDYYILWSSGGGMTPLCPSSDFTMQHSTPRVTLTTKMTSVDSQWKEATKQKYQISNNSSPPSTSNKIVRKNATGSHTLQTKISELIQGWA